MCSIADILIVIALSFLSGVGVGTWLTDREYLSGRRRVNLITNGDIVIEEWLPPKKPIDNPDRWIAVKSKKRHE